MNRRERTLVLATVIAGVLAGAAWGYARLAGAADAAASAARAFGDCERLARRIDAARGEGQPADVEASTRGGGATSPDLSRRIEAAARAADLPKDRVVEPGPPRRLGDGPFMEHPTGVQLRGVDLRQLFTFLHALASADARVGIKNIRLTIAPGDASTDRWNVDGTLTQTIYSPKDPPAQRPARVERAASDDWGPAT